LLVIERLDVLTSNTKQLPPLAREVSALSRPYLSKDLIQTEGEYDRCRRAGTELLRFRWADDFMVAVAQSYGERQSTATLPFPAG
jgi:hypothetical protein